ncbi:hypothetical protein PEXP_055870 [Penicillium expansum]|nr:hypothetical protein PEXP_055870 [Penicillium expansum]
MVTRTRTPNGTPHASMSSEIPAPSSQTQRSGFSTSSTQISTTSGTSSLIDHPSNKPTENSVPPSVPGLVGTSASLVPGTSTPDETPNSSNDSSDTTSHRALATTTDISSSTEDGIVALATYSSRSVTSVTTVKGVTSNSHTSTVGTDHHTTLIPIVGGFLCWFCPPDIDAGFGLSGMGSPGVYPPGPPPPGFPSSIPAITVDSIGKPTYSSANLDPKPTDESSSSSSTSYSSATSSSSCTITETASSCTVITSYGVDITDRTTATFTTTSCTPISGCTITGATETSVTTSTTTASCYKFPDDTTFETKRDVDEDKTVFFGSSLWPRGRDDGYYEFGTCNLGIVNDPLHYPSHPGPSKIVDFMKKQNTPLKGLYIVPEQDCGVAPKVALLSDFDTLTSQTCYDQDKKKYAAMGASKSPFVQTEHVYELQTMPAFLTYLIDKNLISCEDMKKTFFPSDGKNLGKELFNQLPSFTNPDFVVLDNSVNDWKGKIFNGKLKGGKGTAARLKEIYNVAMAFDYMRIEDVYTKFQTTNARIYEFLRDTFDYCGSQYAPQGGWAPAYSRFMSAYLSLQGAHAATEMSNRWTLASKDKRNGQAETDALSLLTQRYPPESWNFDIDTLLSWPAAGIGKRTECPLDMSTSSSDGSAASSTQTSEQVIGRSSTTSTPTSGSPTSEPATPGSPINSQFSPTQTQAPINPFGTGNELCPPAVQCGNYDSATCEVEKHQVFHMAMDMDDVGK